ncbi:MAG: FHA domain-containing protein [Planctomycetaceae bacterium]|jgi:signal transduction histidine kinase/pSer/pThr/pTyr-binding forkhead associated (FHA) protein|nr:FHA domain-containing protein [Planctomycetaceae bacterium]
MSSLFVILGAGQGIRHELLKQVVTIGRDVSNAIRLNDVEASRRHAEIRRRDDADILVDLGSSNGVYVNGKRINEQRLENGDQIQIGKTLFLYTRTSENRAEHRETLAPNVDFQIDNLHQEPARILHAVKQEEGSRLYDPSLKPADDSWLAKTKGHLQVMYHTTLVVSQTLDIDRLLSRILELIFEWVNVDRGCILLFDSEGERLLPRVSRIRNNLSTSNRMTLSRRILDTVLSNREGVLTSDAQKDARWEPDGSIVHIGVREAICVPMQGRYGVVGVIYIDTTTSPQEALSLPPNETKSLTSDHLKLMVAIAHQAALAVEDTRYYQGMVQAERLAAIGQTVAALSHHIKNILQGISGGNYLIEKGLADADHELLAKGWRIVEKNQNKISDLVMDMLTFSKEREPNFALEDVNRVVSDVVELMYGRACDFGTELIWLPDETIPMFLFDAEQIHRAVTNIVTNAIDAAQSETSLENQSVEENPAENYDAPRHTGRVEIRTDFHSAQQTPQSSQQEVVRITVDDNGTGIPQEMFDSLFRPFLSNKKGNVGTGLGLAVTRKIFEEHGGRIRLESSPSGGARFILELPLRKEL